MKVLDHLEDNVNHPSHYTQGKIECIDAMVSAFGAEDVAVYCRIAAFKYLWRSEHKGGLEDIRKAMWYLKKYQELNEVPVEIPLKSVEVKENGLPEEWLNKVSAEIERRLEMR